MILFWNASPIKEFAKTINRLTQNDFVGFKLLIPDFGIPPNL